MNKQLEWFARELRVQGGPDEICQCGTAKAIKQSSDPERFAAVFFAYALMDQFIYTNYRNSHAAFKAHFVGPKLAAHGSGGHASPEWLVSTRGNGIKDLDWQRLGAFVIDVVAETIDWLRVHANVQRGDSLGLLAREAGRFPGFGVDGAVLMQLKKLATHPESAATSSDTPCRTPPPHCPP